MLASKELSRNLGKINSIYKCRPNYALMFESICLNYRELNLNNLKMTKSNNFENLILWQKAHSFVLATYQLTKSFPKDETYGLTSQFKRAAISIAANIAEGYKKKGIKDKLRFYNIAQGSLEECRYFLILTKDLEYKKDISEERKLLIETSKLLNAYCRTILKSIK